MAQHQVHGSMTIRLHKSGFLLGTSRMDDSDAFSNVSFIWVYETDSNSTIVSTWVNSWDDGDILTVSVPGDNTIFAMFDIDGNTDLGNYVTLSVLNTIDSGKHAL